MKKRFETTLPLAGALLVCAGVAWGQDKPAGYPNKAIRIISSVQPGAGGDTMARIVAQIISDKWGTNVVVDNRSGAGGTIASELVARSTPDGYTLYSQGESLLIQGATKRVPFDAPELVGTTAQPALVGKGAGYEVFAVRWPSFGDVHGEGLLLVPTGTKVADVVAIPDADQTPEQLVGLATGIPAASQFARRLAESGCRACRSSSRICSKPRAVSAGVTTTSKVVMIFSLLWCVPCGASACMRARASGIGGWFSRAPRPAVCRRNV